MALKGNIESFFLASIFQLLHNDMKTGSFRVFNGPNEIKIIIKEGTIVYATSSKRETRLGTLLLNKGVLSLEQLEKCLAIGRERKQALGKVLVEQGYVRLEQLQEFIHNQVEGILTNLFSWEKGKFVYEDAHLDLSRMVITQLDIINIIVEASRRIDELSVLKKQIPTSTLVFKLTDKARSKERIKLKTSEWKILSLVDGMRTVKQLVDENDGDEFKVYKGLHSLMFSGLVEEVEKLLPEGKKREEEDYYSDIITGYHKVLQAISKNLEPELGRETFTIFDESKREADYRQKGLFDNFHPDNTTSVNIYLVREQMKAFKDKEEGHFVLVESFNRLVFNVLERGAEILGTSACGDVLRDIEKILPHLDKYRTGLEGKPGIVDEIKIILAGIGQHFSDKGKGKQQTARLFSMFSRK